MIRSRAVLAAVALLVSALAGCGVQPTDVLGAGEPATGLPQGMRVYFASDSGLRGVARPGVEIDDLRVAIKLLLGGPNETELHSGLSTLSRDDQELHATSDRGQVTVELPDTPVETSPGIFTGQVVCTLARAESLLHGVRPDEVQVTLVGPNRTVGPYRCPQFLTS
ncbi:hypothetical protein [Saccharopolyspora shandongensis]|uniref:hypothetical protein n=1 Tax=Saccharopolyspora shandongensis TaxID=418495 RepID=UPI0033C2545C